MTWVQTIQDVSAGDTLVLPPATTGILRDPHSLRVFGISLSISNSNFIAGLIFLSEDLGGSTSSPGGLLP